MSEFHLTELFLGAIIYVVDNLEDVGVEGILTPSPEGNRKKRTNLFRVDPKHQRSNADVGFTGVGY